LKASLPDSANVLNVDAFTASHDEVATPAIYNLTNAVMPACNIAVLPGNSSLFCNAGTLNFTDPHYLFADAVHPTPYGHLLFATYVLQAMTNKGWY
jgi:phospholipase/lecithinase/hemolysin